MKKQLTFVSKNFIYLSLITLVLLGVPVVPAIAQGPRSDPVQLIPPAQLGQSFTFVGAGVEASINPLGSSQLLGNPGFENGGWSPWQTFGAPTLDSNTKHSGSKSAHLGNTNNANDQVIQTLTVPANASDVTLDFWYRLDTGETAANADFFCYGLWDQSGVTVLVQRCLDLGATGNRAWNRETYSLTANERAGVSGQTVLLAFIVQTSAAQPSRVWIDDTELNITTSTPPPPPTQHKVFLPVLLKAPAAPPPPPGGEQTGAFWLPYIGRNDILTTYGTSVAVDSTGGIHVGYALYSGLDNGQRPAYYAYCAANCASLANWSLTRLSNYVQDVRLALDPLTGHPRMMFYTSDINTNAHDYQYAACEGGCTSSANWTITVITIVYEIPGRRSYHNNRYFAPDPQGGPAFIYTDSADGHTGTFYAHCNSTCTNAGNWSEIKLFEQELIRPALAFTPAGQPRLAASYYVPDDPQYDVPLWKLLYGGCYSNCNNPPQSQWDGTFIYPMIGDGSFSLRVDANGQPRIALYPTAADLSQMQPGQLYYVWCNNTTCLNPNDWNKVSVGTPINYGDGVDLVLDPANRPRLAYQMGDDGLGYAWCDTNCGVTSSWQTRTLESTAAIIDQYPPGLPQHQNCPILTWLNGVRPSLALDPAGKPRVGYDTELWWGGSNPNIICDIGVPVARFGLFN